MRRQFRLLILAITSMIVIAFVVPLAFLVRTLAEDRAISRANADAQYVGQLVAAAGRSGAPAVVTQAAGVVTGTTSVYYSDGTVIGDRTHPPGADSLALARRGRAFSRQLGDHVDVFVPVLGAGGRAAVVRVSVSRSVLDRGVSRAWIALGVLGLVLVLVAVLVADRMARSITAPMRRLTDVARRLAAGDLGARASMSGPPEVVEVSDALDTLAGRIGDLLQAEREHAADLSHRLRTPLTALRLDAELLADEREAATIAGAVDELEDAVTRVIADTRAARRVHETRHVDLSAAVRDRMAYWSVLARGQDRAVDVLTSDQPLAVDARRHDVQELVDVLVGNVLRHTPAGVALRVTTGRGPDGRARLTVEDAGSGFDAHREHPTPGSGRGLDIARRIAESAGGSLTLGRSELGGARVDVDLGASTIDG